MSESLGTLEAKRILKAREQDTEKRAWQLRKAEILRAQAPLFFAKVGETLQESANDFNRTMGLEGEDAMSVQHGEHVIDIEKRHAFYRKIVHYEQDGYVKVRTVRVRGLEKTITDDTLLFDVSNDGIVELSRLDFVKCAERLFSGAPDAFRD
jgi:hypothetical protein